MAALGLTHLQSNSSIFVNKNKMVFVIVYVDDCYDPGSSLHKRSDLQGKDGSTSIFCNLTNGVAWVDSEDNVSRTRTGGSKSESLTATAEAGAEDTSSDSY